MVLMIRGRCCGRNSSVWSAGRERERDGDGAGEGGARSEGEGRGGRRPRRDRRKKPPGTRAFGPRRRSRGGQTRKEQIGTEGYREMGRKGGLSTTEESGGERAAREGIPIDESKFKTSSQD